MFVLDASVSINQDEFQLQTDFVASVISEFDINPHKTRIGLITFSSYVQDVLGLGQNTVNLNLLDAIKYVRHPKGNKFTDQALLHAREMLKREGRKNVPKIIIVLTGGKSDFPELTKHEAEATKKNGVTVFSIGIGKKVDLEELRTIASSYEYAFTVDTVAALNQIGLTLAIKACDIQADAPWYENEIIKVEKTKRKPEKCKYLSFISYELVLDICII